MLRKGISADFPYLRARAPTSQKKHHRPQAAKEVVTTSRSITGYPSQYAIRLFKRTALEARKVRAARKPDLSGRCRSHKGAREPPRVSNLHRSMDEVDLSLPSLQGLYAARTLSPTALLERLYPLVAAENAAFVTIAPLEHIRERCRYLESLPESSRPALYGVPFAVKDNVDVVPYPTTAACPAFQYTPEASAPAVQALLDAGGVMVGKTNMDQFAAGLVGTRTPYGTARNAFDDRFVPGGSSSGSGALVGSGLVTFALGTDTAGSGRVPAMLNGCVGIKPTVGRISTTGVVPACKSLDCISCFARTVEDAATVVKIMQGAGVLEDPWWRPPPSPPLAANYSLPNGGGAHVPSTPDRADSLNGYGSDRGVSFRFGIPGPDLLSFLGPGGPATEKGYEAAFKGAIARMEALGGELVPVDFEPFTETALLLYNSAFVAERYSAVRSFLEAGQKGPLTKESIEADSRMEKVTSAIIAGATRFSAVDAFDAFTTLNTLRGRARPEMAKVDLLLVPTLLQNYLIAEIEDEEKGSLPPTWPKNGLSGRFTNFVNLLDMAAIAVPSSLIRSPDLASQPAPSDPEMAQAVARREQILRETGNPTPVLPFGVTLIGPAWSDEFLWDIAARMHKASGLGCGPAGHGVKPFRQH